MKLGALFGWGIVIYALVWLAWSGMELYGWVWGAAPPLLLLLVLLVSCVVAGGMLPVRNWKDILPYSIGWACIAAALDAVFIARLENWSLYASWSAWAGYALIALFPLLSVFLKRRRIPHGFWET